MRLTTLWRELYQDCIEQFTTFFKRNLAGASSFSNFWKQGHTTTPGAAFPTFCENCEDSLMFPVNQYRENPGDGACSLSSCSEKTRASNHLQMS